MGTRVPWWIFNAQKERAGGELEVPITRKKEQQQLLADGP